ncbi:MAG: polymorphic toxin-type HINT domain-containing protein, partial [Chloroflexota bacterium]
MDEDIIHLYLDGELIQTTAEHPFYTDDGVWVDAADLTAGEQILSLGGDYGVVDSVVIADETQTMYDLDVETVDTFAVGDGAWVVHNQDPNLSDISRAKALYAYLNPIGRQQRLNYYATDLVIVATNVQKLNRLVETSIIFDVKYDPNLTVGDRAEMVRHNNNTFGIGIGRPTLRLSQQEQIRTAGHQLWHIELARIGESTNAAFGTPEYALEEVNVERRNLKGLVHQQSEFDGLGVECWYGQTQRQPH